MSEPIPLLINSPTTPASNNVNNPLYRQRRPEWLKVRAPSGENYHDAVSYTHLDVYKRQT